MEVDLQTHWAFHSCPCPCVREDGETAETELTPFSSVPNNGCTVCVAFHISAVIASDAGTVRFHLVQPVCFPSLSALDDEKLQPHTSSQRIIQTKHRRHS